MFDNEFGPEEVKADNQDEELIFHYSRKRRLETAPESVQDAYNGNFQLNKGFKVLFKNKTNRFLLITLVTLTAFALIYGKVSSGQNKAQLSDYNIELSAFAFEENIYASAKISEAQKKQASQREPVSADILFEFYDVNGQLFEKAPYSILLDSSEKTQGHKTKDFEVTEVRMTVSIKEGTKTVRADVKR